MAKLKAPLMSLGARGQLGKALVFFPWKGLDVVREFVVPANPKSTAQLAQRTLFTAAVTAFHTALYSALDMTAWNRLAGIAASVMTGFNRMCQDHINEGVLGSTWTDIKNVVVSAIITTGFTVNITKVSAGNAPTIRWGTSKTWMPDSASMADLTGNDWDYDITGLSPNTLYYFTIDVGATGVDWGRVGIYQQRTAAS